MWLVCCTTCTCREELSRFALEKLRMDVMPSALPPNKRRLITRRFFSHSAAHHRRLLLLGRLNVSHRPRKAGWAWPPCISRHRPPWLSRQWPRAIRQPAIALSGELHIDCMPTDHSNASAITPDLRQYSHLWTCGSALASCLG